MLKVSRNIKYSDVWYQYSYWSDRSLCSWQCVGWASRCPQCESPRPQSCCPTEYLRLRERELGEILLSRDPDTYQYSWRCDRTPTQSPLPASPSSSGREMWRTHSGGDQRPLKQLLISWSVAQLAWQVLLESLLMPLGVLVLVSSCSPVYSSPLGLTRAWCAM